MEYLLILRAVVYSAFLLFIYWDSTIWKLSTNILGEGETRVTYGLLAMTIFLGISSIYLLFFKGLFQVFKKNGSKTPNVYGVFYVVMIVFCFKYCLFGDIGVKLEKGSSFEVCQPEEITTRNHDCAIEIKNPSITDSTLRIYDVGQVKGDHGWRDLYQGFYILKDDLTDKQFVVRSSVVSGDSREYDIEEEVYQESEGLLLFNDNDIKASQKEEALDFLKSLNLASNTPIYKIKSGWWIQFAQKLLYWGVYVIVLILVLLMIALSLPDKETS